ncbi:hypothetical protein BSKO_07289 [Bryopsis sp. KO-2023]|nr:hypothetical protein BSKO_07289 [Bryopsis sp. KO-2023]
MLCLEDADFDLLLMEQPKQDKAESTPLVSVDPKGEKETSGAPPAKCFGKQHPEPIVFQAKAESKDECSGKQHPEPIVFQAKAESKDECFGKQHPEPVVFQAKAESKDEPASEDVEMKEARVEPRKRTRPKRKNKSKQKKPPQKMIYTDYDRCHGSFPPPKIIESEIHLEHRMDTTMEIPRRHDTLHVFGVDIMGTSDIFGYFRPFKPLSVEWLNDSSCNVVLSSEDHIADALGFLGRPVPAADMPSDAIKDKGFCMTYLWYRARPFLKGAAIGHGRDKIDQVHLMLRMATVEDTRPSVQPKVTRKLWMQDRKQMQQVLYQDNLLDHELAERNNRKRKTGRNDGAEKKKSQRKNQQKKQAEKKKVVEEEDSAMMLSEEKTAASHPAVAANLMPSDLRDFITKLRAVHVTPAEASQTNLPG